MKATARKMKDSTWIAEVIEHCGGNMFEQNQQTFTYSIVAPSHKEWLKKNNMDGKEIEGEPVNYNGADLFTLSIPPIHSDPAGEFNWAEVHKDAYDFAKNTLHWVDRDAAHFAKGASWKARTPTPQTGRTYTEGERNQFALDFAGYVLDHTSGFPAHNSVDPQKLVDYLKQNPKP